MGLFIADKDGRKRLNSSTAYINDYEVRKVADKNGKEKEKVVYIGPYIPIRTEKKTVKQRMIIIAILSAMVVFCLGYSELINHGSQEWAVVTMPLAAELFPAMYLIMGVITLPYKGNDMKRDEYYHGIVRVMKSSVAMAAFSVIVLVTDIIYNVLAGLDLILRNDIIFCLLVLGTLGCSIAILLLARSIDIDERVIYGNQSISKITKRK